MTKPVSRSSRSLAVEVQEERDDAEWDDDRQDRPRLAQPLAERDRRDLGRLDLERLDERLRVVVRVGLALVEGGCGLHRTGPYRTVLPVSHRTMVLPVVAVHGRPSLATGLIRPLPRSRLTPFAIGVQSLTK